MTPNYRTGDVILWPTILDLLTDTQAMCKIRHTKVTQNPCTLVLDVCALGDGDSNLFQEHAPQRFSVCIQRQNLCRARSKIYSFQLLLSCTPVGAVQNS